MIMVGALATSFVLEGRKRKDACERLGGYAEYGEMCYKEDSHGELIKYRVKLLGGKYRLVSE